VVSIYLLLQTSYVYYSLLSPPFFYSIVAALPSSIQGPIEKDQATDLLLKRSPAWSTIDRDSVGVDFSGLDVKVARARQIKKNKAKWNDRLRAYESDDYRLAKGIADDYRRGRNPKPIHAAAWDKLATKKEKKQNGEASSEGEESD
jgi:hypothetical protein